VTLPGGTEPVPYLSLYRRFRPQRFDEVLGQEHVTLALRNAVRDGRMGHAYLFSGPRGTGKTSTARILAKALDCADPREGEPCGACESCVEIARGTSLDVHELDAASNNGVDAMRDLVAHSALGTPGRWKVYIVDEVHMLSTAASNALLKTLEEPPSHVVFVLATTDTQKVLPTIRSRTQHFEFRLLGPEILAGLLRKVRDEAGLDLGDEALDGAVRRGRGSARDALSALDQVAAGGTVGDEIVVLAEIAAALAVRDAGGVLVGVAKACNAGHDPQRLAGELADYLRQGFLGMLSPGLVSTVGEERAQVEGTARRMGLPAVVRAMEALGRALVDMRDTPDPRVHLEATLIRLAHPEADDSTSALLERVERLERAVGSGLVAPGSASTSTAEFPGAPAMPPPARREQGGRSGDAGEEEADIAAHGAATDAGSGGEGERSAGGERSQAGGPELARRALGALRGRAGEVGERGAPHPGEEVRARSKDEARPIATATLPSRDELVQAWGDGLLASLPGRARARFRTGRFVAAENGAAVFALPNETQRSYCEEVCSEVESVLAARFGTAVPLRLVVDDDPAEELAQRAPAVPPSVRAAARRMKIPKSTGSAKPGSTVPAAVRTSRQVGARYHEDDEGADSEADLFDPKVLEAETEPAGAGPSPEERIKLAFPGAEEV
jgi:DNA polymerase-3 subunit gamma/tau